ncbi:FAD-binding domain-containing protein [Obba rivulosa]|uniref:FAD-binding domain-containing protein n=1 Tax=Obba rivulosa TaxID=1052685 RepID=A0A8E2DUN9_9APHY|nr:FAD-binding domain-containing protein [Obba rivulosa]
MADFDVFKNDFRGDIVTPSDPGYEDAIFRWSRNGVRRAQVVTFPKDETGVAQAIAYSKQAGLPLAIRGGGHSASGASSTDGLVVDLSRYFDRVRIDPDKKVAYVGGGTLWGAVEKAAIQHGLATVGGTVNHTGCGGLIVGGGYGWLSGKYGLAIDNLVQATVVTANGSILTANATENSDLFWGIRGGGCNFGVVTEFVLKLHPQRRTIYAGFVVFSPDKLQAIASAVQTWWLNGPSDNEAMMFVLAASHFGQPPAVILNLVYNGSEAEGREKYKVFFDFGPIADMSKEIPFEKLNEVQNHLAVHGRNNYEKGTYHSPNFDLPERAAKTFELVKRFHEMGAFETMIACELIPMGVVNSVADDSTAFRRGRRTNVITNLSWDDDAPETYALAKESAAQLIATMADVNPSEAVGYGNYNSDALPAQGTISEDRSRILFDSNYPRLQALKRKYDPDVVFNKWFVVTPATT